MARSNRYAPAGQPYHVVNRGNDRRRLFEDAADYRSFTRLLRAGLGRCDVEIHAHCLMPNHFHLVIEPWEDGALSAYMQWLTGCYACYLRERTGTVGHGHVFQRRFWSTSISDDVHLVTVIRYVEANPVRAGLVSQAELWPWSSLRARLRGGLTTSRSSVLPGEWRDLVNLVQRPPVLRRIRGEISPRRGRPPARS